ncbi:MFS transporter [Paenibacillus mucilaginosus]|nr:MFS transporter [Paenibacillus caseinilyticus]
MTAFTGLIQNTVHFILVRFGLGLFEASDISSSIGLISRWLPPKERGRTPSLLLTSAVLGSILPILIAVPLTRLFGDWRPVYYVMLIPGIIAAWAVWKFVYSTPQDALGRGRLSQEEYDYITEEAASRSAVREAEPAAFDRSIVLQLLRVRTFWLGIIVMFGQISIGVGFSLWQSTYLMEGLHYDLTQMGLISLIPAVTSLIEIFLFGYLHDRLPSLHTRFVLSYAFWRRPARCS